MKLKGYEHLFGLVIFFIYNMVKAEQINNILTNIIY